MKTFVGLGPREEESREKGKGEGKEKEGYMSKNWQKVKEELKRREWKRKKRRDWKEKKWRYGE
jgi:hypothetical protein